MDTGYVLSVEPQELQFPFELRKQISCSLHLLNKSENYVAFKVMTTNPKQYRVRPNAGVVPPRSTCDVIVTMQAQTEAAPDMQCKDKFLLRSVVASPGATAKDVNAEMFNKEAGHHVEECKLKVVYVAPPRPPSSVREGSEEGSSPRASVSDDGSLSASVQTSVIKPRPKDDPANGSGERLLTAFPSGMPSNIGPTQYSYEQLSKATGYFSNKYLLGEGGFSQVYKGALHGEILAIKKLRYFEEQTREELVHEIAVINSVRHCNLVKLLGYCIEGANALLVLEYCLNKSLRFHLHGGGKEILDWPTRMKIARGSAKGLEYLHEHSSPRIIHRDIKPDNILLNINFEPKIADFGLALFFPNTITHISRSIAGTEVYIDPEYSRRVSSNSDVYSFGVVLLELITGRKPKYQGIDIVCWAKARIRQALNGQYTDFVDSNLQSYDRSEMEWMISCAAVCVYNPFESRPQMKEIVRALEGYGLPKDKAEQCGWQAGGALCPGGLCCSQYGWCANTPEYCGSGCQSQCDGGVGGEGGCVDLGCANTPEYCGSGCQSQCDGGVGGEGGCVDLGSIISRSTFEEMLKHRNDAACPAKGFYTYDAFISAAKAFPAFGTTGDVDTCKREIAAFFGQTSHATTGGWPTAPDGPYAWGYCHKEELNQASSYCSPSPAYPCAPGKKYYGRGPIQLSWNYNYGQCGQALGLDLLNNPDLVATDRVISFKAAIWFWMTPQFPKPSCHDVITGQWSPTGHDISAGRAPGYGVITNIINGGLECGRGWDARVEDRIGFYKRYCDMFGVGYGSNLDCYNQKPFGLG
ncbi:hypothetical protein P3X46_001408 [Hevea brasiliensis]|uniref:non-specific serine/threonine protein kinase n=1 Tax=Hevea brasiliensis TaxID=3981 RepID=A0ABQ9NGK8_HEVBR|nr:hypothetical protein P3X46_001408 [Hevea brasiliensis]